MNFDSLGLQASLLQAVQDTGYTTPTPIQLHAIPAILSGRDVMAAAQTGTGKTAGFTLPLLQRLGGKTPVPHNKVRALILSPTRELAAQIQESIETYGKHEKLRSVVVFGGVNINPQMQALRKGCDLLVATPGRLLDLYQQNAVRFDALEVLVLDEADRMLDMGFIRDIRKILAMLPKQRQNLLFSATFSDEIRTLAKTICHDPLEIDVAPRNSTVDTISQRIYRANKEHKLPLLAKLLQETPDQVLVFSRTKHGANNLVKKLTQYDIKSAAIHGNKSQSQRTKALADFKNGQVQVLIATDIAARGIDIEQLALVINHDMPQVPEDYVHRIGRTGRAGASGAAVSLVSDEETGQLRAIERLIKRKIDVAQFDPASLPVRNPAIAEVADDERGDSRQARPQRRQQQPRQGQPKARVASSGQGRSSSPRQPSAGQGTSQGQPRSNQARPQREGQRAGSRDGQRGQAGQSRSPALHGRQQQSHGRPSSSGDRNGNRIDGNRIDGNRSAALGNGKGQRGATSQPAGAGPSFWQRLRDSLPGM